MKILGIAYDVILLSNDLFPNQTISLKLFSCILGWLIFFKIYMILVIITTPITFEDVPDPL